MELMRASSNWANRPADQRFWTVQELVNATLAHRNAAKTASVDLRTMQVGANKGEIELLGRTGAKAQLTHWAFSQLCQRVGAPASYLRSLPTDYAVHNLNYGLEHATNSDGRLLLHENGGFYARAITSEKYTRIWNYDIAKHLLGFESDGWKVPPARPANHGDSNIRIATAADANLSLTVKAGDEIGPAGLYASFEDMFAFMLHPENVIQDGTDAGLMRGFFVWNSEVGKSTFGVQTFLFRGVCGNHIVWDATNLKEIRLRHVGNADERAFQGLEVALTEYANESATETEAKIARAKTFVIKGKSADDVIDVIFSKMRLLTRSAAMTAYNSVIPDIDGQPYTAWGFAQGITRMSQMAVNADTRVDLDRAAGKVLEMAF